MITQLRLKQLLHYNPLTGIFTRNISVSPNGIKGDVAGTIQSKGYIEISVDYEKWMAHRLAFIYMEGYNPENEIDHINQIKTDNRWKNLREVSRQCNSRNCGNYVNNKSGVKGVCWAKRMGKWKAAITINIKSYHIGFYKEFDEAVCARLAVEQCLGWSGCESTSPAYQYVKKLFNHSQSC